MKGRPIRVVAASTAALGLALAAFAVTSGPASGQTGLAGVRAATARYHDVDDAVAAGYVDLGLCFDQMGEHYGLPAEIDGVVEDDAPEALVYAHEHGRLRLVAVEYVATGPGEVQGLPLHYNETVDLWVLHAWVWMHNHDGMHADFNPAVGDCPAG